MASFGTYPSVTFWIVESGELELPVGAISMWSLLNGTIPTGWAECDGTANAPGPDLRNFFVVGRGTKTVDTTGGAATHGHSDFLTHAVTQPVNHVVTQPVAHTDVPNHTHPVTDPGHFHDEYQNSATTGSLAGWGARDTSTNTPIITGYDTGSKVAGVTTQNPAGGVASQPHSGAAVDAHSGSAVTAHTAHVATNHEPAWYALIYIQRMT